MKSEKVINVRINDHHLIIIEVDIVLLQITFALAIPFLSFCPFCSVQVQSKPSLARRSCSHFTEIKNKAINAPSK